MLFSYVLLSPNLGINKRSGSITVDYRDQHEDSRVMPPPSFIAEPFNEPPPSTPLSPIVETSREFNRSSSSSSGTDTTHGTTRGDHSKSHWGNTGVSVFQFGNTDNTGLGHSLGVRTPGTGLFAGSSGYMGDKSSMTASNKKLPMLQERKPFGQLMDGIAAEQDDDQTGMFSDMLAEFKETLQKPGESINPTERSMHPSFLEDRDRMETFDENSVAHPNISAMPSRAGLTNLNISELKIQESRVGRDGTLNLTGTKNIATLNMTGSQVPPTLNHTGVHSGPNLDFTAAHSTPSLNYTGIDAASNMTVASAIMTGAQAAPSLNLTEAQIAPSLNLTGVQATLSLNFTGAQAAPSLNLTGAQAAPSLNLTGAQAAPSLNLTGAQAAPSLNLTGAQAASSLNLTGAQTAPSLNLTGVQATPSLNFTGAQATPSLNLTGAQAAPSLNLTGAQDAPSLNLTGAQAAPSLNLTGAQAAPSLNLTGAQAAPALNLTGALAAPSLNLTGAQAHQGYIATENDQTKPSEEVDINPFSLSTQKALLSRLAVPVEQRHGFVKIDRKLPSVVARSRIQLGEDSFVVKALKGEGGFAKVFSATREGNDMDCTIAGIDAVLKVIIFAYNRRNKEDIDIF